jgi:hypothetical protein
MGKTGQAAATATPTRKTAPAACSADEMIAFRAANPSPAEIKQMSVAVAEAMIDERLDRWRNGRDGYDRMARELGLAGDPDGITELLSGQDKKHEFRAFARDQAAHFVQGLLSSSRKINQAYLSEHISHGANHTYRAELCQEVDLDPQKVGSRIFGRPLSLEEEKSFRRIAGLQARPELDKLREADGIPKHCTDFWYMVRKRWQDGEITNRQELAAFTADQIQRYGSAS